MILLRCLFLSVVLLLNVFLTTSCTDPTGQAGSVSRSIMIDTTFASNGYLRGHFSSAGDSTRSIVIKTLPLPSGALLVLTNTSSTSLGMRATVSKFSASGSLDTTFASTQSSPGIIEFDLGVGDTAPADIQLQSDGKILVAGGIASLAGSTAREGFVLRLTAAGALDTSFGTSGIYRFAFAHTFASINSLVIDSVDRITFTGFTSNDQTTYQTLAGRLIANGALDTTFYTVGYRIIDFNSAPNYSADNSNGVKVLVNSINKIILISDGFNTAVTENSIIISQLNANGTDDTSFSTDGYLQLRDNTYFLPKGAVLNSTNQIILLTDRPDATLASIRSSVIRITTSGAWDATFGTSGFVNIEPPTAAASSDGGDILVNSVGQIIIAGMMHSGVAGEGKLFAQIFSSDGSVISTIDSGTKFMVDTIAGFDEWVQSVALDSSNQLLITGEEKPTGPTTQLGYVVRLKIP